MRRLRVSTGSLRLAAEWGATASAEDRSRMAELLRTLQDGSWDTRWWTQQQSNEPEVIEIRPDAHMHVFMRIELNEVSEDLEAEIFSISDSTVA